MIAIELPFPPSVNNLFSQTRAGRRFVSSGYRKWKKAAEAEIMAQRVRQVDGKVDVRIELTAPDNRRRDPDNYLKAVLDLLVSTKVLPGDDSRFVRQPIPEFIGVGAPRARVILTPVPQ